MIDINSNCSRVDAVKAMASQLKMQVAQAPHTTPPDKNVQKAQSQLDSLDIEVKKGDAQKAEIALSTARSAVTELQTQRPKSSSARGLDVYA